MLDELSPDFCLPVIMFDMFKFNLIDKKENILRIKILQCIQNDVVVNFNDVIRIAHCALNIESAQSVAFLTFELTFIYHTFQKVKYNVILFYCFKDAQLERFRFKYYYNSIT